MEFASIYFVKTLQLAPFWLELKAMD